MANKIYVVINIFNIKLLFTYFIVLWLLLKPLKNNESNVINKVNNNNIIQQEFLKLSIKIGIDIKTEKNIFVMLLKYINLDVLILLLLFFKDKFISI